MRQKFATELGWAHPVVAEWFTRRFDTATEPQLQGWPAILAGRDTLISAPTGSGKTLAAFLICIDRLVRLAAAGELRDETSVVYVSPLKALSNDVQKNLDGPLGEIVRLARERGLDLPDIRTAVRTGDTLAPARRAMLQRPPHILVTTPESLYILLTAEKSRANLRPVTTVIVDEIHAVADDKRGAHLALTLERLTAVASAPIVRIGLSATQRPLSLVGEYLVGSRRPAPAIVEIAARPKLDLAIEVPASELGPIASNGQWEETYDRLAALVAEHRSTLIFVNTRRLAERVSMHLSTRLGADHVAAHHGSLSRRIRLDAEERLKRGALRVLVATASLELGIDIGAIDLVCQIGSPRAIGVALQRIGRAGHWRGAIPKGRLFPTTLDDLVECSAVVRAIRARDLDRLQIPDAPLDVLAQQIVAMCATDEWTTDDLFGAVTGAYPYRALTRERFDEVLEMLSQGISATRGRYGAHLFWDKVNGRARGRRGARLTAIVNGGAIPDTGVYTVYLEPEGTVIGTVDEDFAVESMAGDVMLLGNSSWRIRRVTSAGRVLVEDAHGAAPTIPFWRGEAPARPVELSQHVAEIRETVARLTPDERPNADRKPTAAAGPAIEWSMNNCGLDRAGAEQLVTYIVEGRAVLGAVPTFTRVIAERFFDEGGGMQLVIHAPFGARVNKAWGLALRKRFCRSFNFELQAAATDNGITISLAEQHSFPLADVFHFLHPNSAREVLEQAALPSPLFGTRWRWDATRSLALQRFRGGRKVPLPILRIQSDDLLAAVFPDVAACQENIEGDIVIPQHPLVQEVMKDVLTEAMDLDGFVDVLRGIGDGRIECLAVDTPVPSPFAHEILNANPYAFLDDAPLEERRARAVELRRVLPQSVLSDIGRLDPAAIHQVRQDAWPDVRDPDDLHDALQSLIVFPEDDARAADWLEHLTALQTSRRIARMASGNRCYWVAAERRRSFEAIFPDAKATTEAELPSVDVTTPTRDDACVAAITGWMSHIGPTTAAALAERLGLSAEDVDGALLRIEAKGAVLRGQFTPIPLNFELGPLNFPLEWCDRRLLARIHRLTIGALRREIAPVSPAEFMRWLLAWQHVTPGTQATGERGLLEVIGQLQGFEAPANAWERDLIARRVAKYQPDDLDRLCLGGAVGWGRLSPHPALAEPGHRRVTPTSVAPITFFVREQAGWLALIHHAPSDAPANLSANARAVLSHLHRAGASFFPDLVRATGQLKAEVETALWELVSAGIVTADGFDNLRALIDPRRRAGQGSGKHARPRHSSGRWAALFGPGSADSHVGRETAAEHDARLEATCHMLLARYGVVFRELLARESILPPWRELLVTLRRLEARGDIRGGRFVENFIGEQFAAPIAVDSLRAWRHRPPTHDRVTLSGADPLNLVGVIVPGDRVAAVSGKFVTFVDGVPAVNEPALLATGDVA